MSDATPIVVFSHLRWDFVYQRPQHLLARLAVQRPVFYIEEPVLDAGAAPHWETRLAATNVLVCQPHTPVTEPGYCPEQLPMLQALVAELAAAHALQATIVWLYTPLALPLAEALGPRVLAYDCMDELSMFKGAPPELLPYENRLLATADVVFTGGPSLYRAKQGRNAHLFCYPSSVDADHFRSAQPSLAQPAEPEDQSALPHPRLGFYGVIDERMDLELLDGMAQAHPEWQMVLVGPVVKIDPDTLPRHPNLHYLGQRGYADLPRYLGGWDVCLLPFARNDSTRFISPTKTLEYMAAERMIVSTPITDVAAVYGDIVFLGDGVSGFIEACERALSVSDSERQARVRQMREVLQRTSWQATASAIEHKLGEALERCQPLPAATAGVVQAEPSVSGAD